MIQKLIIDGKQACGRCGQNGAAIKCKTCKTWYHGNSCSEIFLTQNFKQEVVCLKCLTENVHNEISATKKDQLEQKLWIKDDKSVYRDYV